MRGQGDASATLVPCDIEGVADAAQEWDRLAELGGSPFLTYEWIVSWWRAIGDGEPLCALLRDSDGSLIGGACCRLSPRGEVTAPTDHAYGYEWDVVARDAAARREVWQAIARFGARRVEFTPLPSGSSGAAAAAEGLRAGGYRISPVQAELEPYLPLPASWDDLLRSVSRNLRSQWRRNRRDLEAAGGFEVRVTRGGTELERDLDTFLRLEASGWKGRSGTAILCDRRAEHLFRSFAALAARHGWLRLTVAECGGNPVAAVYGCSFAGSTFRLKSAFDESRARNSPGLVLLGEDLRRAIEEGSREYRFLGAPDEQKMRWGAVTRPQITIRGYRGATSLPAWAYRAKVRPVLGVARRWARARAPTRGWHSA
jgi:CelD/BcsL family acetyltransferase involved in cellulose biosynthesis